MFLLFSKCPTGENVGALRRGELSPLKGGRSGRGLRGGLTSLAGGQGTRALSPHYSVEVVI